MLLPREEAEMVFKLHGALMHFVNEQLRVITDFPTPAAYLSLPPAQRHKVGQAFLGRMDLIDAFIAANPTRLSPEDLAIVSSWRHLVTGRFIALRQLKKHMILLTCDDTERAFGVLGLSEPIEHVIQVPLPAMIETVLLPFRGRITYDGLVSAFPVRFGPGSRRGFEDSFRIAKAANRMLTSLGDQAVAGSHPPEEPKKERPAIRTPRAPIASVGTTQRAAFKQGLTPYVPADRAAAAVREQVANSASRPLFQFKITLRETEPPIWRRIQVFDDTLDILHEHIQNAMGWTNSHLHDFIIAGRRCGDPELLHDDFEPFDGLDSTKTLLSAVLPADAPPLSFEYRYDFGDDWKHDVLFEGCLMPQPGVTYPQCLEGARACPPEDVGGIWGYAEYLEALADPKHERHQELLTWNGPFNPESFNPRVATHLMQEGMPDWRKMH